MVKEEEEERALYSVCVTSHNNDSNLILCPVGPTLSTYVAICVQFSVPPVVAADRYLAETE